MNRSEFLEILHHGENSKVEFKSAKASADKVAKEVVSFLNHVGGRIFLGVEDDRSISGVTDDRNWEEWIANICRDKIYPPANPALLWIRDAEPVKNVLVVEVVPGKGKPYAFLKNKEEEYYIRVGSTVRKASREELQRLFQTSGQIDYGLKPVYRTHISSLDSRRLDEYFYRIVAGEMDSLHDADERERRLLNLDLMIDDGGISVATVYGMLLFGNEPKRFLPQSGIRALCYPGSEPDYATRADEFLNGPMVPLQARNGSFVELGLVDQAWDFVRRNTVPIAYLDGMQRVERWEFPENVVKEAIANALVHRDYSITGTDIMLTIFSDRMEIESPGSLPNTVTIEKMKAGIRYRRNQTLLEIMRDYGYTESRGMGVRSKIIPGMLAHNGTEPDLIDEEDRFTVRLWKGEILTAPRGKI